MNIFIIMIVVYIAFIFIARYLERLCNKLVCDIGYTVWGWLTPGINILISIAFVVMIFVELLDRTRNKPFVKKIKNNKIVKWFTYVDYR